MVVDQLGTLRSEGRETPMADDLYAEALLNYWTAVKDAERTIAPFFEDTAPLTPVQRGVVAAVVAQVSQAEAAYFAALEAAGHVPPKPFNRELG
jgi:hypothetical protein